MLHRLLRLLSGSRELTLFGSLNSPHDSSVSLLEWNVSKMHESHRPFFQHIAKLIDEYDDSDGTQWDDGVRDSPKWQSVWERRLEILRILADWLETNPRIAPDDKDAYRIYRVAWDRVVSSKDLIDWRPGEGLPEEPYDSRKWP